MNQWANAVLTEKGATLLSKLTQGNTLNMTKAITGSGFVIPGLLVKQTEIVNPQQTLKFKSAAYPEEGKCKVTVSLTNEGLATGYSATQVGIFATDPDDGEILFIITQAQDAQKGTIVPSETEMPGHSAEWNFYFQYGQANGVNIVVDPTGAVSRVEMETFVQQEFDSRTSVYSQTEEPEGAAEGSVWVDQDEDNPDGGGTTYDVGVLLEAHKEDKNNPHGVTIAQIGAAPARYGLNESNGNVISVQNSGNAPLHSLKLYGKTTQNGTPTPESPVELKSVGDDGSISVKIGVSESDENPQNMTIQTPNGLPGIPVSSGGNYTDENGQQWICDEIDFARGKYIKRVRDFIIGDSFAANNYTSVTVMGNTVRCWVYIAKDRELNAMVAKDALLCDKLPYNDVYGSDKLGIRGGIDMGYANSFVLWLPKEAGTTAAAIKAYLDANPLRLLVADQVATETDLTAEEIAAYSALHTNYPNTTVYNDAGADMEVEYYSPISAVPMNMGSGRAGHIMTVDEHGCVNTAPKSSMPFAPAGYGLGDFSGTPCSDCNAAVQVGFYTMVGSSAINTPSEIYAFNWGSLTVDASTSTVCHTIKCSYATAHRVGIKNGETVEWEPWEYDNPPMDVGVEYRTTERWNGHPVYCKAINFGTLPNKTSKTVAHGISNKTQNIRHAISTSSTNYMLTQHNGITTVRCDGTNIAIATSDDFSTFSVTFTLWYIKD